MREIELTQGKVALVDDADYERVSRHKWCASRNGRTWYAIRREYNPKPKQVFLHRFILDAPDSAEVDHKDGNGLNCQRDNLRLATHAQNQRNQKRRVTNKSGYKGVSWYGRDKKWRAVIGIGGKVKTLGCYATAEEAARAYDEAARELFGEFAKTNF